MCLRPGADMICFLPGLLLASQLAAARPRRLCSTQLRKPLNCFAPPCWGVPISPARWPRPPWVRLRTAALIEHLLLSVVCPVPASDPAGRRHSLGGSLARRRLRWRLLRQARALAFWSAWARVAARLPSVPGSAIPCPGSSLQCPEFLAGLHVDWVGKPPGLPTCGDV